jgi:hypothetical protein
MNDKGELRRQMIAPLIKQGYTRSQAHQMVRAEVEARGLSSPYEVRAHLDSATELRGRAPAKPAAFDEDLSSYGRASISIYELRRQVRTVKARQPKRRRAIRSLDDLHAEVGRQSLRRGDR